MDSKVAQIIDRVPELAERGRKFTFANFADKSPHGTASALRAPWLVLDPRASRGVQRDRLGIPRGAVVEPVSLGHNSPEQQQAIEKLDNLVAAVRETNEFPGDPEFKEQIVTELSAGRRLLEATKVRVSAVREALQPALRWIAEKAGGAVIGKLAGDLWQYLAHLQIF